MLKSTKGISLIAIIIIVALVLAAGTATVVLVMNNNKSNNNSSSNGSNNLSEESTIQVGEQKIKVFEEYEVDNLNKANPVNGYGLFKVGDEYVFKGGDSYTEMENDIGLATKFKQGYLQNVVKFNNNYWRMVKINKDGSIKLVYYGTYDETKNSVMNYLELPIQYVESKTDNFTYENSNLREYLNNTVLNNTSIIPSNYSNYLVKSSWDISNYDHYHDITSDGIKNSNYEDYVGVLSLNDYKGADYAYQVKSKSDYKINLNSNFITDILKSGKYIAQYTTNTSNIIVNEEGKSTAIAEIKRISGDFKISTEYNVDQAYGNNVLPVITLKSSVKFSQGNGTIEDPFVIE